uniref:Uncharacterized protein n=1 Tax=Rhizophora mucronata TaxID=61149 RepID=A0A2P2MID3_RHIMU
MSDEGEKTCPLCAEDMDLTDQQLKPCKCGYEVCGADCLTLEKWHLFNSVLLSCFGLVVFSFIFMFLFMV